MKIALDPGARMPARAHPTDAGLDLYSRDTVVIPAGLSAVFDTGVHIELLPGFFGKVESRSGLNLRYGVVSCGGVIDVGFTGSIKVKLYNLSTEDYKVNAGDRIAQLVILPYAVPELELVDSADCFAWSERGENGYGSSGA